MHRLPILLLAISCVFTVRAAQPTLSLSPGGVDIDAGAAGKFTIPPPSLNPHGGRATYTLSGSESALASYPSGAKLEYHLDARTNQVTCIYSGLPSGAHEFRFSMSVPLSFNQGGKYSFNTDPLKAFPPARSAVPPRLAPAAN